MIEYVLVIVVLAVIIVLAFGTGKPRRKGPPTSKSYSDDYHGVYSHSSKSIDSEAHFPVRKDSTSIFPMNKRKERKKTETHQPRR